LIFSPQFGQFIDNSTVDGLKHMSNLSFPCETATLSVLSCLVADQRASAVAHHNPNTERCLHH
jgi:hypothetical protein